MTVKLEIKDQLAKLLATEDLIVEHKNVSTASFDVDKRVLVLPTWDRASNNVYDLLVGHEVGHALYTPNEDLSKYKAPQTYINVTEDARIEKLIKRKFPGLAKSFYRGYWELNEKDFFGIADEDIENIPLIDRINLYFKGNNDIPFSDEEKILVEKTSKLETFNEACDLAAEIYSYYMDNKKESSTKIKSTTPDSDDESMPNYPDPELSGNESEDEGDSEGEGNQENNNDRPDLGEDDTDYESMSNSGGDFTDGMTDKNLQERLEELVSDSTVETTYLQVPDVNIDTIIVPTKDIWEYYDKKTQERVAHLREHGYTYTMLDASNDAYLEFKSSARKEVNYLVKEFECRKSASAYARTSISRTGVLDTKNLHTYKFNEDIFKKISVIPEGKNHGLIFVLDWSGSMHHVLKDTVKQLLNIVWFCKKVKIPFEVYAFTNEWYRNADDDRIPQIPYGESLHQENALDDLSVGSEFNLLNILSSKTCSREFDEHCRKLFHLTDNTSYYEYPRLCLSGTPLNETLISLHKLIPRFRKEYGVEKLNTIILTDGESQSISYITQYKGYDGEEKFGKSNINGRCVIRDRKLGRTYDIGGNWYGVTKTLLINLSEKFSNVNFVGIRLMEGGAARRFISQHSEFDYNQCELLMKLWKKNKSISISNVGYTKFFGMSSNSLSNDSNFEVDEDATKAQIKRAFVKSRSKKKLNKKILSEFIELIV